MHLLITPNRDPRTPENECGNCKSRDLDESYGEICVIFEAPLKQIKKSACTCGSSHTIEYERCKQCVSAEEAAKKLMKQ